MSGLVRLTMVVALAATVQACGTGTGDRAVSGAGIGAAGGAAIGALFGGIGALPGALIGAAAGGTTGALTNENQIYLGQPVWQ